MRLAYCLRFLHNWRIYYRSDAQTSFFPRKGNIMGLVIRSRWHDVGGHEVTLTSNITPHLSCGVQTQSSPLSMRCGQLLYSPFHTAWTYKFLLGSLSLSAHLTNVNPHAWITICQTRKGKCRSRSNFRNTKCSRFYERKKIFMISTKNFLRE